MKHTGSGQSDQRFTGIPEVVKLRPDQPNKAMPATAVLAAVDCLGGFPGAGLDELELGNRFFDLAQSERHPQIGIDSLAQIRAFDQSLARVLAPLADALAFVAVPGAALFEELLLHTQIEQIAFF